MKRKSYIKGLITVLIVLVLGMADSLRVRAAFADIYFGSESYEWSLDQESKIGVYLETDDIIDNYEIKIAYDPQRLEYIDGAELLEEGLLVIQGGNGTRDHYRQMLRFRPLAAGITQVQVIEASVVGGLEENTLMELSPLPQAPVTVAGKESVQLSDLMVNGVSVEGFSPEKPKYELEVSYDTENLDLSAIAADQESVVLIENTPLTTGYNQLWIRVTDREGTTGFYCLEVYRSSEALSDNAAKQEEVPEERVSQEPVSEETAESESQIPVLPLEEGIQRSGPLTGIEMILIVLGVAAAIVICISALQVAVHSIRRKKRIQNKRKALTEPEEWDEETFFYESLQEEKSTEEVSEEKGAPVISVQDVTMRFRRAQEEASSLKEFFIRTLKGQNKYEEFTALEHISFDVYKGEVVGIIGTNGSGKSTILKIISGVLHPTQGQVIADRKKIQLLTLGTGFDMELTGRENVYLNGAIIGYTKEYIDEKYDDIVKFAELEGFMEEKVKNYSSGMVSRLGFAIATMRDTPEILILDEVLSVGDMFFRKKSEARIREMMHGGSTVLIVSHSIDTIKKNCNKAVWIEKGKLMAVGKPDEVCAAYAKLSQEG